MIPFVSQNIASQSTWVVSGRTQLYRQICGRCPALEPNYTFSDCCMHSNAFWTTSRNKTSNQKINKYPSSPKNPKKQKTSQNLLVSLI
jgi:hypothetical protein